MSVAITWWLFIEALGLIGAPLAVTALRNLPDRGWALSKPLSLIVFGWLIWFPLSVVHALPFSQALLIGALLAYLGGGVALVVFVPTTRAALVKLFRHSWDYVALTEAVFSAAYALMLWVHSFTPAIVDTEKFMDVAFLSAIWRAPHLPPPDPWLSGYTINYYYFGHYLMALVAKLLGTQPGIAFNLALGLTFALAAVAICGVAANLVAVARGAGRSLAPAALVGALSVTLTLLLGDFNGAQTWLANATQAVKADPTLHGNVWSWWTHHDLWMTYDWWTPSRVAPHTINEFPAFSFVLGDLHAHVLALPFAAQAVGVAFNLLLGRERGLRVFGGRLWPLGLLVCAVALGGLYLINGWDLPTYLGLALLALALQQWLAHDRALTAELLTNLARAAFGLVALAVVLYLPFYLTYSSPGQGIGVVPAARRTAIGYEWDIFALFIVIALSYLAMRAGPWLKHAALPGLASIFAADGAARVTRRLAPIPGVALAAIPLLALGALSWLTRQGTAWTLLWAALLVGLAVALLAWWTELHTTLLGSEGRDDAEERVSRADLMATLVIGVAAALIGVCEIVFLRDVFGGGPLGPLGDDFRMNTVFKFYYQVWLLLGILSGPALLWVGAAFARVFMSVKAASATAVADGAPALATASVASAAEPTIVSGVSLDAAPAAPEPVPVATGALPDGWRSVSAFAAGAWTVGMCALLLAGLIYPTMAVAARTANLSLSRSLDGTAYMAQDASNAGDAQAIAWLNAHVSGDLVILEAAQYNEYTHLGRVSAFTGLPTLVGWGGHEVQWRYNWLAQPGRANVLGERLSAVKLLYTSADAAFTLSLLRSYHVRYVYVGAAERQTYGQQADHFAAFLNPVYSQAGVTIYAVPDAHA